MPNRYSNLPSLTGQVFGKWTVGDKISSTKYRCTCECGNTRDMIRTTLILGRSLRCRSCNNRSRVGILCIRNHDTSVYGRGIYGECRACAKENSLKRAYGMSLEDYENLFIHQKGKCAICERSLVLIKTPIPLENMEKVEKQGRAEVDHKHLPKKEAKKVTKKSTVRGLLCGGRWAGCNAKLGRIDNAQWLSAAAAYVTNPPAHQLFKESKVNDNK